MLSKIVGSLRRFRESDSLALVVVFGAFFFSVLQVTVVVPILPAMLDEIYAKEFPNSTAPTYVHKPAIIGAVLTTGGVAEIITMPLVVLAIGSIGHKYALYLSSLLEVLGCGIMAFACNLVMIFVGRAIQCVGTLVLDVAGSALIAARFNSELRSRAIATALNGIPLGYVTSSLLGTIAYQHFGYTVTLSAIGLPGVLEAVFRFVMVHKPTAYDDLDESENGAMSYSVILSDFIGFSSLFLNMIIWAAVLATDSTAPNDMTGRLGGEIWHVGVLLAIGTAAQVIMQILVGELGAKFGMPPFLFLGIATAGVGMIVYPFLPSIWWTTVMVVSVRIGLGAVIPATGCLLAEVVNRYGSDKYEHVYGLLNMSKVIGITIGASVGGCLNDNFGIHFVYWLTGSIVLVLSFISCCMRLGGGTGSSTKSRSYNSQNGEASKSEGTSVDENSSAN